MRRLLLLLTIFLLFAAACRRQLVPASPSMDPAATTTTPSAVDSLSQSHVPVASDQPTYQPFPRPAKEIGLALPPAANSCETVGEVWNFDGLDGCGLLLQTTQGHLFAVNGLPQGYVLENGMRIRFGFSYLESEAERCTRQDALIRITCMQVLRESSGFDRPFVCQAYDTPTAWLKVLAQELRANYITRFPWAGERFVYLFETSDGQYLYDCQGLLLCRPKSNCLKFIDDFSLGKLIYEG